MRTLAGNFVLVSVAAFIATVAIVGFVAEKAFEKIAKENRP